MLYCDNTRLCRDRAIDQSKISQNTHTQVSGRDRQTETGQTEGGSQKRPIPFSCSHSSLNPPNPLSLLHTGDLNAKKDDVQITVVRSSKTMTVSTHDLVVGMYLCLYISL